MSALDKIRQAFPELANASDSEVLGEAARRTGVPVSQLSDTLGIAPSSTLGEIGKQLYAGVTVDAPRMAGQALKYYSDAGGERLGEGAFPRLGRATGLERQYGVEVSEAAPGYRAGQALVESADVRGRGMEPDLRGRGLIGEALVTGARGVGGIIPTLGLMAVPGGQALAPALQAALFGGSSAQDSYEKLVEQGVPEEEAAAAARRVWGIQGVGEGIATAGLGALLRPAVAAVRGARSTSGVAQALTDTSVLRPLAKGLAANIPLQAGTEAAQDVGTALVEQSYGAAPEDLGGIARGSALAGAGMTLLLGPLALGGSISRSRNAQRLTQALYGQDTAPEVREAARLEVMEAARQQGVDPANAEEWLQRQLREEAANIAAVQQQEEKTLADLAETPYADIAYALRDPELSATMSEPDRTKLFSTLTALQNAETPAEQRDALVEDANETIGRYVAALQGPDAESDLTQPFGLQRQPLLTTPQPVQELNLAGGLTQVQTIFPDSLSAYQAPAPAGREMTRSAAPAPVEGVEGIEAIRPGVFQVAQPLQQVGTFVGPRAPQPVTPPGAPTAVAAALPAAPAAAGVSSTTATTGAPSGTQAPKAVKAKTQRAKAPAAPAAAVVEAEDKPLLKLIEDADNTDVGNPLPAAVRGAETVRAPGRASMTTEMLKKVRDALLRPSGKVGVGAGEKEQRIVNALGNFASAYKTYLDQGGQALSRRNKIPKAKTAAQFAETQVEGVQVQAANVQAALAELGEAVGGNAKDIEAVVRLVKDMVQGKIVAPGKTRAEVIQAGQKLDTMLSQAWAAAKREAFMQAEPDLADIRGGAVRVAREQAGEVSPLEKAATEGVANPKGKGEKFTGLQGVLQYIRNSGTPFERMLAATLRDVIGDQMSNVKLEFIAEGDPRFDPKTNTVYLRKNESPEVALHEALHAALQSFVYKNPKDPMVMQLKRSLKAVVEFKGELTGKAKEVQDLLKKLMAEKSELDAVLELVSYGTTLNEFRKALEAMPSKGVPQSFRESVNSVWRYIKAVMARMLNKPNTVAADVLDSSLALLEKASKVTPEANAGNVLEAAVQTTKPISDAKVAEALGMSEVDYTRFAEKNLVNVLSTQRLFEAIGWSQQNAEKLGEKLAKWGRDTAKKYPGAEIVAGLLNSRYHGNRDVSVIQDNYKFDKNVGYQVAERIANYITSQPAAQVNSVFAYLDGDKRALDGMNDGGKLKGLADNMKKWFDLYVSELSPIEQQFFRTRKFSENLLFPSKTEEVARNQFGLGKINEVLGKKSVNESNIDENWFSKTVDGDPILDGDFYQVFKTTGTIKDAREPAGFMSAARFADLNSTDPLGYAVDTTRKWILEAGDADKGKFKFTTNTTAREKIADEKADDLANALRNTMAALANNYASKNFISAMAKMGSEDSPAPRVAFDSVEQINKEYGINVRDDQVLKVSLEMARSEKTKDLYRMSGTWVQLPKSDVYGALSEKLIPGPVWNSMIDMFDRQPVINVRAINTTMRWFKKSKTVFNFGTHVTNAASNITMGMMHDISFRTMRDATSLLFRYEVRPQTLSTAERQMVEAFINSGAMLGDFSSAEVKEAIYSAHENNLRGGNDNSLSKRVAGWMNIEKNKAEAIDRVVQKGKAAGLKVDDVLTQMYAFEDNAFRMAAFMKKTGERQMDKGLKAPTDEIFREAGQFALKAFGDYDIDAKAVKALRQTVMPFISWGYAMGPVIGRIVLTQPWKIANIMMAYYLLEAAMSSSAGDDDEETRQAGPAYVRERMFFGAVGPYMHIRIPFMGDAENPVYYKLGDYFPLASMTKGLPNGFAGQSWFPSMLTPSGPFVSTIAGIVLGVDPYTGKSIHQPTDTEWQKLWNTTKFGYDIIAPPSINSKQIARADDFFEGKTGITGSEPSGLVFARAFGLKLYDYNVVESEAIQEIAAKKIQREFKTAMTKAKQDEYRKGSPDYDELDRTLADLQERMEKEIAKAQGEE
jgi:hypothetical protein